MLAKGKAPRPHEAPSFAHLRRMTDDTGMLEHALGRIPRRREGYTTDDNARALWTVTEWLSFGPEAVSEDDRSELARLADIYLAFMLWTQNDDGWWDNNIAYDRSLEPEEISHDCQGRSLWSCADAWIRLEGARQQTARVIVERAIPTISRIDSLRGQAFAMASCAHLLEAAQDGFVTLSLGMEHELRHHLTRLEDLLCGAFRHFTVDSWRWFEPAMTYSNGVLPWAMLRTCRYTRRPDTLRIGLDSLSYLLEIMTSEEGWLRPIGNEGWCTSGAVSRWDQQPLEMFKLALALEEAALAMETIERSDLVESALKTTFASVQINEGYLLPGQRSSSRAYSGSVTPSDFRELRDLCRDWFFGSNDHQAPLVDPEDGSCCDGLMPHGPNINCGAEATLSYLMTEAACRRKV
jgi:hypothetical protein